MNGFTVCIAGVTFAVEPLYSQVRDYCSGYLTDLPPMHCIVITPADIAAEHERSARTDTAEGRCITQYPEEYLEELAVYRKIAEIMPSHGTVLFHGSVVAVDGAAYMFTAKSGTGKSTHTRLWRELLGSRAVMINDDKPMLHIEGGTVTAFGTPYSGKHRLDTNTSAPLRGLCLLSRSPENTVRPLSPGEAWPMLMQQVYRPADPEMLAKTLTLTDTLSECVPLYGMGCNMDISAAELAYSTMTAPEII